MAIVEPKQKDLPVQVFQEMDRRDENQILSEMRGELLEEFVYSIRIGEREVTNLSYAGIKEAIRRRGQVEILEVRTEQDEKEYRTLVRVRDHSNNIDVLGAGAAEKNKPFAWVLAANKAERNAFGKLIPAKWYATLIQDWLSRHDPPKQPDGTVKAANVPTEIKPSPVSQTQTISKVPLIANQAPWRVPVTPEQVSPDQVKQGIQQFPLLRELRSFGMVNVLGEEIAVVPERPVSMDNALIDGFLVRRIIEPLVAKHGLAYTFKRGNNGFLEAVLIRGKLPDKQFNELVSGARWAFERALEAKKV